MAEQQLTQYAPWPDELEAIVYQLSYKPGWRFTLETMQRDGDKHTGLAGGLTLVVLANVYDAYHPDRLRPVWHYFPVPAATYNADAWKRWVFECVLAIEQHEASEYFGLGSPKERPFAPTHGPGDNPYTIVQYATDSQRRTSFEGVLNQS